MVGGLDFDLFVELTESIFIYSLYSSKIKSNVVFTKAVLMRAILKRSLDY